MEATDSSSLWPSPEQLSRKIKATSEEMERLDAELRKAPPADNEYLQQCLAAKERRLAAAAQRLAAQEELLTELYKERDQLREESGLPFYRNITVDIISEDVSVDGSNGIHMDTQTWAQITDNDLQRYLRENGCVHVLCRDTPLAELERVSLGLVKVEDGVTLTAFQGNVPLAAQLCTFHGFVESIGKSFEEEATAKMCKMMRKEHPDAHVVPISRIASTEDGKVEYRRVDGVVVAPGSGCAAILEAHDELGPAAVEQLTSRLDFIEKQPLAGEAAVLNGKKLQGFLAGRTVTSDPTKLDQVVTEAKKLHYPILLASRGAWASWRRLH